MEEKEAKLTPLYAEHLSLGAKMVDFHGWLMPLYYQGITQEVKAVRERAGLFDLSHMGELVVRGEEAEDFLQWVSTNDLSKLEVGQMQYSFFLTQEGTVLDDFMLYRLGFTPTPIGNKKDYNWCGGEFMAVVNASNTSKIFAHLKEQQKAFKKVELTELTEELGLVGLQGPNSEKILQKFVEEDLSKLKYLHSQKFLVGGEEALISRSGYTGEDGFEIYVEGEGISRVWQRIFEKGKSLGLEPAGLGARDILRCEMGYPLYGQEWDETITPWEAGFFWVIKLNKNFLGKEALVSKKAQVTRKLVGFRMLEKAVPRHQYLIKDAQEKNIGWVTSGTFSPTRGDFIGMGYVLKDSAQVGGKIFVEIRGKLIPAEIVKLPFVKPHVKKW